MVVLDASHLAEHVREYLFLPTLLRVKKTPKNLPPKMVTEVESIGIPKQNGLGLEEERNGVCDQ
jgi:hypothetical protein